MLARVAKASDREVSDRLHLKILSPKQLLQRLTIALTPLKVGNTPQNLLNETPQFIYDLYRAKKVYNNIMNSMKV